MTEPTIAEERIARMLAYAHGATPLYMDPQTRVLVTVATSRKMPDNRTGHWEREFGEYEERYWREYLGAARAVIEFRSMY